MTQETNRPWYKEPMVWLVIAIPAVAVVLNVAQGIYATATFDGVVEDDYYKKGKAINMVLARDNNARQAGIVADLDFDYEKGVVSALITAKGDVAEKYVTLKLIHTTVKNHDQTLLLEKQGDRYVGNLEPLAPGRYEMHLEGGAWRLVALMGLHHLNAFRLQPTSGKAG